MKIGHCIACGHMFTYREKLFSLLWNTAKFKCKACGKEHMICKRSKSLWLILLLLPTLITCFFSDLPFSTWGICILTYYALLMISAPYIIRIEAESRL